MDVLISETCWALNNETIKQVTSSWSLFIQLLKYRHIYCLSSVNVNALSNPNFTVPVRVPNTLQHFWQAHLYSIFVVSRRILFNKPALCFRTSLLRHIDGGGFVRENGDGRAGDGEFKHIISFIGFRQLHNHTSRYIYIYFFSMALRPNACQGLLMLEVSRSHTATHHSR